MWSGRLSWHRHCEARSAEAIESLVFWIASPSARNDELSEILQGAHIVFIADFDVETTARIHKLAKQAGALVNAEDKKDYCDFHVPAIVRRGDLLLTVSTNAKSPRLARRIRQELQEQYGEEWAVRLEEIGEMRQEWLKAGLHFEELAKKTDEHIDGQHWLKESA